MENCFIESLNGKLRDECSNQHRFATLAEAQHVVTQWRDDYNNFRPHRSLGYRTPSGTPREGAYQLRRLEAVS